MSSFEVAYHSIPSSGEFILLELLRLGKTTPEQIQQLKENFMIKDQGDTKQLTYEAFLNDSLLREQKDKQKTIKARLSTRFFQSMSPSTGCEDDWQI